MRTTVLVYWLVLFPCIAFSQINNPGFETTSDSSISIPKYWKFRSDKGAGFYLDSTIHHTRSKSLCITSPSSTNRIAPFSQTIAFQVPEIRSIQISAWIKLNEVAGNAGLWCQIRDKDDKVIGFRNLEQQGIFLDSSAEWKKYALNLIVNKDCRNLVIGGYLRGKGSAWFDDYSIEIQKVGSSPPVGEAKSYINKVYKLIKHHSIFSDQIQWDSLDADLDHISRDAVSFSDADPISNYMLSKLQAAGDHHSFFMSSKRSEQFDHGNLDERKPSVKLLSDHIGYVYVPGMLSLNKKALNKFADSFQRLIQSLDSGQAINSWVVDLRENTGGNMYPMIAGLGPLLGNGTAGYFIKGNKKSRWYYKNGKCGENKSAIVKVKNYYCLKNPSPRIAILIGGQTSSSGEMTAISFIGKPNTRFFGQTTGGYTTGNSMFKLPNHARLFLASSYSADRNRKKYTGKIVPDEIVEGTQDALDAALVWIKKQG